MKHLTIFLLPALVIGLLSCGHSSTKNDFRLSAQSVFNKDSVVLASKQGQGAESDAEKLFKQAIDLYRNKKKAQGSIPVFKQSLYVKPMAKTYYELGNALSDVRHTSEAVQAYSMAEMLNYKPMDKLLYNMACAYSILKQDTTALYYLVSAIEFGYKNTQQIFHDPDLENIRKDNYEFTGKVNAALSGSGDPELLQWKMFAHNFKKLSFPVLLDTSYMKASSLQYNEAISYDYERYVSEMRDSKFSRDVGKAIYTVGQVRNTDSVKTLVYAVFDEVQEEEGLPYNTGIAYYLVSYDAKGKLIDKLLIGGQTKLKDPFLVASLAKDNELELKRFNLVFEKDPDKDGYENNALKTMEPAGADKYTIDASGHFIRAASL